MKIKNKFFIGLLVSTVLLQSSYAALVIENTTASTWDTPQNWTNTVIWKTGVVAGSADDVVMSAKPVDYTVNISASAVTVKTLKTNYQNDGDIPTLNISTNFTISNFLEMGNQSGGTMVVADGGNVLLRGSAGRALFGTGLFDGALTVESNGVYRSNGTFLIGANGSVQVDGLFKSLNTNTVTALTIASGGGLYVGSAGTVQLRGNQTTNSTLLGYISGGQIAGAGPIDLAYDSNLDITRLTVVPTPTYVGFTDEYGITGMMNSAPQEDYDGDGQLNIYEFGLGGNPTNSSDIGTEPVYEIVNQGGTNVMKYVHVRLVDADITYHLETDTDLVADPGWTNAGWSVVGVGAEVAGFEAVTNVVDASADVGFVQLVIE